MCKKSVIQIINKLFTCQHLFTHFQGEIGELRVWRNTRRIVFSKQRGEQKVNCSNTPESWKMVISGAIVVHICWLEHILPLNVFCIRNISSEYYSSKFTNKIIWRCSNRLHSHLSLKNKNTGIIGKVSSQIPFLYSARLAKWKHFVTMLISKL